MSDNPKKLASPFSTGGGGGNFETRVQASFLVLMLADGFCPCLPNWPIQKIILQARRIGFETDDLVIEVTDPKTDQTTRLLAQIKHGVQFTQKNKTAAEVIAAAWRDFKNGYTANNGAIAIITGPLGRTDLEVRELLDWARTQSSADEFFQNVKLANFSSDNKRSKLQALRHHVKNANGGSDVSDLEFWNFLKSLHVLQYDLDIISSVNRILITCVIQQFSSDMSDGVWALTVEAIRDFNQHAGTIIRENVPQSLRNAFTRSMELKVAPELTIPATPVEKIDFIATGIAQELAIAALVGEWNDAFEKDREFVAALAGENYSDFMKKLRDEVNRKGTPLRQKNGIWTFKARRKEWAELASYIFDEHLDVLKTHATVALQRRREELASDEPFYERPRNNEVDYSTELTGAFPDTLAMIAVEHELMVNCSEDQRRWLPPFIVRDVLSESDWLLWGTLNRYLPVLAEAAPNAFLTAIERLLAENPGTIKELYAHEGTGFGGSNFMIGILWGLESLAWAGDYLGRVTLALGGLDALDPGGNWANRAKSSLINIYLPWHPQTVANLEKKSGLLEALAKRYPQTGWDVLVALLPGQTRTTSGNHRPVWRDFAPSEDKPVKNGAFWEEVDIYTSLLLNEAEKYQEKIAILSEHLADLPPAAFDRAATLIAAFAKDVVGSEELQFEIWKKLNSLVRKHRRYATTDWAMPEERVQVVERLASLFQPKDPTELHQYLFRSDSFSLLDGEGEWKEQEERLIQKQKEACLEIWNSTGLSGLLEFTKKVEKPGTVGSISAEVLPFELNTQQLLELASSDDNALVNFLSNYARARFNIVGENWISEFNFEGWPNVAVAKTLAALPAKPVVWTKVDDVLKGHEKLYWQRADPRFFDNEEELHFAVDQLLENGRPFASIEALYFYSFQNKKLDNERAAKALLAAAESDESPSNLAGYEVTDLISKLQSSSDLSEDTIQRIEWVYLPLLLGPGEEYPVRLACKLATDPDFFSEVIETIYRGENEEAKEATEQERKVATSAYRLLLEWRTPPGTLSDGSFSSEAFLGWLKSVEERTKKTGRFVVAMHQLGEVLIHVPADESGFWMNKSVAEALDSPEFKELRAGYRLGVVNSRGVHWVDPSGAPEDQLAAKYRERAETSELAGFVHLAATLKQISEEYEREAERVRADHQDDDP